jgi:hypothetical protein
LQINSQISQKFFNDATGLIRGLGDEDHGKNQEVKNPATLSLSMKSGGQIKKSTADFNTSSSSSFDL